MLFGSGRTKVTHVGTLLVRLHTGSPASGWRGAAGQWPKERACRGHCHPVRAFP